MSITAARLDTVPRVDDPAATSVVVETGARVDADLRREGDRIVLAPIAVERTEEPLGSSTWPTALPEAA